MAFLKKICERLCQFEEFFLFLLFFSLVSLAFGQVILRNFFDASLIWADVAVRVLVLWVAIFGAMVATRRVEHIQMDILTQVAPLWLVRYVRSISFCVAGGVAFVVAFYSFEMVRLEWAFPTMAFAGVPTWLAQGVLPFGFVVMGIRFWAQGFSFWWGRT